MTRRAFERDFAGKASIDEFLSDEKALEDAKRRRAEGREQVYVQCVLNLETGKATYRVIELNADGDGFEPCLPTKQLKALPDMEIAALPSEISQTIYDLREEAKKDEMPTNKSYSPEETAYLLRLLCVNKPVGVVDTAPADVGYEEITPCHSMKAWPTGRWHRPGHSQWLPAR
ncbi:MAG: hypothetical protein LBH53_00510 [Puniceicoccales bacterium]|nr:hypothetical protein [Puniceicoccales bacterium]